MQRFVRLGANKITTANRRTCHEEHLHQAKVERAVGRPAISRRQEAASVDKTYRIRIGDYRVVYEVSDEVLLVLVIRVAHRKDVYR
ncbi:MAG: type II toxin-antitoxin system RelE/ParE family toxin [Verrucomicrobia bacterium]|nr:type II toxin-antitoxin system RelE/ParE family toxin [Verrucomicrobiota bacterium]